MHKILAIVIFILTAAVHKTNTSPGQSCECEELAAKVAAQQAQIDELKGQFRYAIGWTQASNNLFYKLCDEEVNYETAKSRCGSFGARLVAAGMRTEALRREIKNFFPRVFSLDTWIGLDDYASHGSFVWSDGVESTTGNTDWFHYQLHSRNPFHRCVLNSAGHAFVYTCLKTAQYLCESVP